MWFFRCFPTKIKRHFASKLLLRLWKWFIWMSRIQRRLNECQILNDCDLTGKEAFCGEESRCRGLETEMGKVIWTNRFHGNSLTFFFSMRSGFEARNFAIWKCHGNNPQLKIECRQQQTGSKYTIHRINYSKHKLLYFLFCFFLYLFFFRIK